MLMAGDTIKKGERSSEGLHWMDLIRVRKGGNKECVLYNTHRVAQKSRPIFSIHYKGRTIKGKAGYIFRTPCQSLFLPEKGVNMHCSLYVRTRAVVRRCTHVAWTGQFGPKGRRRRRFLLLTHPIDVCQPFPEGIEALLHYYT